MSSVFLDASFGIRCNRGCSRDVGRCLMVSICRSFVGRNIFIGGCEDQIFNKYLFARAKEKVVNKPPYLNRQLQETFMSPGAKT